MTIRTITTIIIMDIPMITNAVSQAALYRLLAFLSPAFPIGAFTYSHGLEQIIEEGDVRDAASLEAWLRDVLTYGAGRSDAILLKQAASVSCSGDAAALKELVELGLALQPSKERHLESSAQGTAFLSTVKNAWPPNADNEAARLFESLSGKDGLQEWPYPVAVGLTVAAWEIDIRAAITGFLHAFAANLISAAVRAVPLGQTDGQKVLAALEPIIFSVTEDALEAGLEDLGTCTFLTDIASMAHETKYSRLFRS